MHKKKFSKKILFALVVVFLILFGRMFFEMVKYTPVLFELIFHRDIDLKKADNQGINILLLGTGGGTHEGPDLTDTIIFANLNPVKNQVSLVSIPRDMWIVDLQQKINTAYAIGNGKKSGGGLTLSKAVVSKVVGQPVDYALRVNFTGFEKAVDAVGGLDITVDRAFDDFQYPDEEKREDLCGQSLEDATQRIATEEATIVFPCRYMHLHFDSGKQHMDGKRALTFVRSRYAIGPEGTDFARSKRQEKVIQAFREKVLSLETFLSPTKVLELYTILQDSIDTDIEKSEFDDFIRLFQKMKDARLMSVVLDYGDESNAGLLYNPPQSEDFNGNWVLIPRLGVANYSEIHKYVICIMKQANCPITQNAKSQ